MLSSGHIVLHVLLYFSSKMVYHVFARCTTMRYKRLVILIIIIEIIVTITIIILYRFSLSLDIYIYIYIYIYISKELVCHLWVLWMCIFLYTYFKHHMTQIALALVSCCLINQNLLVNGCNLTGVPCTIHLIIQARIWQT